MTQLWQLTLNQSKCKAMRITNKLKKIGYTYSLNGAPLEWVDTFRYLGVRINSKLTWTDHVSEAKTKATRVLNLLRRSMQGCSTQAKARAFVADCTASNYTCGGNWAPSTCVNYRTAPPTHHVTSVPRPLDFTEGPFFVLDPHTAASHQFLDRWLHLRHKYYVIITRVKQFGWLFAQISHI